MSTGVDSEPEIIIVYVDICQHRAHDDDKNLNLEKSVHKIVAKLRIMTTASACFPATVNFPDTT